MLLSHLRRVVPGARKLFRHGSPWLRSSAYSQAADAAVTSKPRFNPTYLVHLGNAVMLLGLSQTDMLNLRCMLVVASSCGISYNLLQPKPLIAPALWGCAFMSLHFYMIVMMLRERRELELTHDEEEVYKSAFLPFGFTRQQFLDILKETMPQWHNFSNGSFAKRKGDEMTDLHYLVEGEMELLSSTGDPLHNLKPGKGGWLGELFDPNQAEDYWQQKHPSPCSFKCIAERCQTLSLCRQRLHETLSANPRLKEAATRAAVSDVWGKLFSTIRDMRISAYQGLLEVALVDGVLDTGERSMLQQFRDRHKISDEQHLDFLKALRWTPVEFDRGRKLP